MGGLAGWEGCMEDSERNDVGMGRDGDDDGVVRRRGGIILPEFLTSI